MKLQATGVAAAPSDMSLHFCSSLTKRSNFSKQLICLLVTPIWYQTLHALTQIHMLPASKLRAEQSTSNRGHTPRLFRSCNHCFTMSNPQTIAYPSSGYNAPVISDIVVVFPAPLPVTQLHTSRMMTEQRKTRWEWSRGGNLKGMSACTITFLIIPHSFFL